MLNLKFTFTIRHSRVSFSPVSPRPPLHSPSNRCHWGIPGPSSLVLLLCLCLCLAGPALEHSLLTIIPLVPWAEDKSSYLPKRQRVRFRDAPASSRQQIGLPFWEVLARELLLALSLAHYLAFWPWTLPVFSQALVALTALSQHRHYLPLLVRQVWGTITLASPGRCFGATYWYCPTDGRHPSPGRAR